MTACPHCGQTMPSALPINVDLTRNVISWKGSPEHHISGREIEVLHLLAESFGKCVNRKRIAIAVWGLEASEAVDVNVNVTICHLRKRLQRMGAPVTVKGYWGVGYELSVVDKGRGDGQ